MNKCYIINTETTEWPIYEGDFRLMFPDTSFPSPLIDLPAPFAWVNDVNMPEYDVLRKGIEETKPHQESDGWFRTWVVYDLSLEQISENENAQKQVNKAQAENLLQVSDWSQYADVTNPLNTPHLVNSEEWTVYRSALRALAINPPVTVETWPTKPEEQWSV